MSVREVRWERMFWHELEEAAAACPVAYFPYGMCEPHGPQNALGLDGLKAHAILVQTAREHGGIVAPLDLWHVHELGGYAVWAHEQIGQSRPWLTAVPPWHHFKTVCYHLRAAEVLGLHAVIFVTGHYGPNWQDLKTVLERAQPQLRLQVYGLPDFEANKPGFPGDGAGGDHAGKVETSLLWALEPECTDVGRIPDDPEFPLFAMGRDASQADLEAGQKMVADEVAWLGRKKEELLAAYDAHRPSKLRTFDDVEEFWRDQIKPLLPQFESMRNFAGDRQPPADSQWRANFETGNWG
ncbi:creatininase family protein [Candidatus Latescibacterota bacterium]